MAPFADDSKGTLHETMHDISELKTTLSKTSPATQRRALDWSSYLTVESSSRRPSALKAAFKHLDIPGIISLGGGLPLPVYFPIHEVTVRVPTVGKWSEEETATHGSAINIVKYASQKTLLQPCDTTDTVKDVGNASVSDRGPVVGLASTLQYGLGTGDPHLVSFLKQHTRMVHNPPYEDWSTTLTCGNTYSFYTCLRMLLERGDYLVMEEYAYSSAISCCGPMGIKIVGIEMDEQGMTATGLENVLSSWDESERGGRKPRVVYLVPYILVDATNIKEPVKTQLARPCFFNGVWTFTKFVKNTTSSSSRMNLTIFSKWIHMPVVQLMSRNTTNKTSSTA
jgi:aromatic amino acid aminotransferase I